MGYTHYDKVSGETGLAVGVKGSEIVVADSSGNLTHGGTAITATAAELNQMDGVVSTAAQLNSFHLTVDMTDISAASSVWVVSPYAATITKLYSVINGAITIGDAAITMEIAGTAVTGGGLTIANVGSAAGTVDSATPTAANTVTAGQAIEIITDGGSTDVCRATFTLVMKRT
jgi:hypothetical protein